MEIKGFTYGWGARKGQLCSPEGIQSQESLFGVGINWMCLTVLLHQKTFASTEILFDFRRTPTDKELAETIARAHEKGVKVCLKPMVNSQDGYWRAHINFPDLSERGKDVYWDEWFESYTAFILHYAEIARDSRCELFCLGCEMSGTERKEAHWRALIAKVREIYSGPLVYNTNHGNEADVGWFDALDYIGTSAYYKVEDEPGSPKETMVEGWKQVKQRLEPLSRKFGKPLIFMEIGCRSARGCAMMPADFNHTEFPIDEEEQANFYDSCLKVFGREEWFAGVFWWDWSPTIYHTREEARRDAGFNVHLKKAEDVLKAWYREL